MPTPPTLVAAYSANVAATANASTSMTLQANDIVTVLAVDEGATAGETLSLATTFSNAGISTLQSHPSGSDCAVYAWTFTVSLAASGTVTVTESNPNKNQRMGVFAHRAGGAPIVARSTLGTGSSRTANYTPSQADSAIVWVVGDWAAAAVQTMSPTPTSHTSAAPGPTAMPASSSIASIYTGYVGVLDDQTSTGTVAYGLTGTGTGPFSIIVVEIQGTGGAAAVPPKRPRTVRQAINRSAVF
jgi:hypothetical protein